MSLLLLCLAALIPSDLFGGIHINCKDAFMGFYQKRPISSDQEMQAAQQSINQYFEELDYKVPSSWNLTTINRLVVSNSILSTLKEVDNNIWLFFFAMHYGPWTMLCYKHFNFNLSWSLAVNFGITVKESFRICRLWDSIRPVSYTHLTLPTKLEV